MDHREEIIIQMIMVLGRLWNSNNTGERSSASGEAWKIIKEEAKEVGRKNRLNRIQRIYTSKRERSIIASLHDNAMK